MRKTLLAASAVALFALPTFAFAQEGTAAGVATGAVTGAIVGGPVGAAIGAGVGGIAGGVAEQNARANQPEPGLCGAECGHDRIRVAADLRAGLARQPHLPGSRPLSEYSELNTATPLGSAGRGFLRRLFVRFVQPCKEKAPPRRKRFKGPARGGRMSRCTPSTTGRRFGFRAFENFLRREFFRYRRSSGEVVFHSPRPATAPRGKSRLAVNSGSIAASSPAFLARCMAALRPRPLGKSPIL